MATYKFRDQNITYSDVPTVSQMMGIERLSKDQIDTVTQIQESLKIIMGEDQYISFMAADPYVDELMLFMETVMGNWNKVFEQKMKASRRRTFWDWLLGRK